MQRSTKWEMIKELLIAGLLTGCSFATVILASSGYPAVSNPSVRFICHSGFDLETKRYLPTTYAWTQRGKIPVIRWKYEWFDSEAWTPQSRCQQVSPRFQEAYENGNLRFLANGEQNSQPVVCAAKQEGGDCATLILTLRPEDDAIAITQHLADLLKGKIIVPIQHSSSQQRIYYQIDIEKFLQTAPVEAE